MVEEQVFQRRLLRRLDLLAVRHDHRAVFHRSLTTGEQLRLHGDRAVGLLVPDFDQTHAATGHHGHLRVPAIRRNLDPRPLSRLNAVQLLGWPDLNRLVVYEDCRHVSSTSSLRGSTTNLANLTNKENSLYSSNSRSSRLLLIRVIREIRGSKLFSAFNAPP